MDYKRMLCWLMPHEKKALLEENQNYNVPLVFAKNFEEFKGSIQEKDYLVFSPHYISKWYTKTVDLVRSYPKLLFHLYGRIINRSIQKELDLMCEANVVDNQYTPGNLLAEFIGRIDIETEAIAWKNT
ncbi:hypothetical protein AGMMS49944_22390 [Spirochaetia bacterium]|nr:hypothetical protein AGMMS49944_22390 [Spirochaetia bacterium]